MPAVFVQEATDFLLGAGYDRGDLVADCTFTVRADEGHFREGRADLVAFSKTPHDMQNACVAVLNARPALFEALEGLRFLTAPLAIVGDNEKVELWSVRKTIATNPFDTLARSEWRSRLRSRISDLSPTTITEAKKDRIQLEFVDGGLESWTRSVTSTSLKALLEDLIRDGYRELSERHRHNERAQNDVLRLIFRLFACRALEDKGIIGREPDAKLALGEAHKAFSENISADVLQSPFISKRLVQQVFDRLRSEFSFATLTAEILAHSYENALVTKKGRRAMGIYYTPRPVTEYILRRLPIEMIPQDRRFLWDSCCGCGSFLLAGFDRLAALLPKDCTPGERHAYLRRAIFGSDEDVFACELASLGLVLTDIHNRNGWMVRPLDATQAVASDLPRPANIIVTNLPFKEIKEGRGVRRELSAEILTRLIDLSADDALFGVIVPQSFLDSRAATDIRRKVSETCDVFEIDLLPGAFFESAAETAVLMMRKRRQSQSSTTTVRELRSSDYHAFVQNGSFTRTYPVDQWMWVSDPQNRFHLSPLFDVWMNLEAELGSLGDVADIRNGLQVKKDDTTSVSDKRRSVRDKPYVDRLDVLRPFALMTEVGVQQTKWIEFGPQLHRSRSPEIFEASKVLINSNRNPGSAWRLVAAISREELYFSDNFHAVIPANSVTVEQLAAVLNSPIANAWFDSRCKTRKVRQSILRRLPFPVFDDRLGEQLNAKVREMEAAVRVKWNRAVEGLFYDGLEETSDTAALQSEIDQLVYDAYGLSAYDRRQVDTLMATDRRPS